MTSMESLSFNSAQTTVFLCALEEKLPDRRDNRGKKHNLALIICAVAIVIIAGCATTSRIFRFIRNRIDWLAQITGIVDATPISRANLPRLLTQVDWYSLNLILEEHFNFCLEFNASQEWIAVDGKTLRGTTTVEDKQGQRTLLAVTQINKMILVEKPLPSKKAAEVTQTQIMLHHSGLEKGKLTLDALHLNPGTTKQINQAGGSYIIQAKDNQSILKEQLQKLEKTQKPIGSYFTANKGHGRIELREGRCFDVSELEYAQRWANSGFATLIVIERKTRKKSKKTEEISFYLSNQKLNQGQSYQGRELFDAIRGHWQVESDNWIRDVTFKEDSVRTKSENQAQVMASLRTLAMKLLRQAKIPNMMAALDNFCDSNKLLGEFLKKVGF